MSRKNKAEQKAAQAADAVAAVRNNPYVQRVVEDDDLHDNVRAAYESAQSAFSRLSSGKDLPKKRRGRKLLVVVAGAGLAIALSEGLRNKVLDALFGAEEEFDYTSTTTPATPAPSAPSATPAS